jgi:hypothetical protein
MDKQMKKLVGTVGFTTLLTIGIFFALSKSTYLAVGFGMLVGIVTFICYILFSGNRNSHCTGWGDYGGDY